MPPQNNLSPIYAFSDRNGRGNAPAQLGAMGHNAMMAHSIRGRVSSSKEGPRYCVACHLTTDGMAQYGTLYRQFKDDMANGRYDQLDFTVLRDHFGKNPGNQMNSPLWVHMVAGLGTGLFLFDQNGCAINPLDQNDNRYGCFTDAQQNDTIAPADVFSLATMNARVRYNLDRIVDGNGVPYSSSNHALLPGTGTSLRAGMLNENMAGPLAASFIRRLTDPDAVDAIILDSWFDANGMPQGGAPGAPVPQTAADQKK